MARTTKWMAAAVTLGLLVSQGFGCGGGGSSTPPPATYSISGTVTGATSVTITLTPGSLTTTTDGAGAYSFAGLANGSYTITPSKVGYTFSPASAAATVSGANVTGKDFVASLLTHAISGTVTVGAAPLAGVTITRSGSGTTTAVTDASGNYTFTGLADGSYDLAPSLTGYTFAPVAMTVTLAGADLTGQSFVATAAAGATHSISGTIAVGATNLPGVTVTLGGAASGTVTTSATGQYAFANLADGAYTVTPARAGYAFTPAGAAAVTLAGADAVQDFAAAGTRTISGTIAVGATPLAGVAVTRTGSGTAATTDAAGLYSFAGLEPGTYTLTPALAGYAFAPLTRSADVTTANASGQDFAAAGALLISGAVSGAVTSGVTISLTGAATRSATTGAGGTYSFGALAPGAYVVTPSLSGYVFTPPSAAVTLVASDATGRNFTSAVAPTFGISGTVSGPWVEGVTVALSGGGLSLSAVTNAAGAYSFSGLPDATTYTLAPSLPGYTYSPVSGSVAISGAAGTQNFTAASAVASFAVSGAVTYAGAATGRVYVGAFFAGCTNCQEPVAGTSLAAPGSYTIRGLPPGSYDLRARMDTIGNGLDNASVPRGAAAGTVVVTAADVTGVGIALADPSAPTLAAVSGVAAQPGAGGAVVFWDSSRDANGLENATGYRVYTCTDAAGTVCTTRDTPASDGNPYIHGATDGSIFYYKVAAMFGATVGPPSSVFGPVPIGAIPSNGTSTFTVSTTVNFPGVTPTGPLYLGLFQQGAGGGPSALRVAKVAAPVSGTAYPITGVTAGQWFAFAIIDQNQNGLIDTGDVHNTGGNDNVPVTVAANTSVAEPLSAAAALVRITTSHQWDGASSHFYRTAARVNGNVKLPVKVTIFSAVGLGVPLDMGVSREFRAQSQGGSTAPVVGDVLRFRVTYSDGAVEDLTGSVATLLGAGAFPQSLAEVTSGGSNTRNLPTFTWAAPSAPPATYTYRLFVSQSSGGQLWFYPQNDGMPSSQTSVQFNTDGSATQSTLTTGTPYTWGVSLQDAQGNEAQLTRNYTP